MTKKVNYMRKLKSRDIMGRMCFDFIKCVLDCNSWGLVWERVCVYGAQRMDRLCSKKIF
jgi:hypothetical protein